VTLDVED
nr:RecName: Full=Unknown protein 2 from 2D-PAGE [Fructilactobacillus sanfranciscensis]